MRTQKAWNEAKNEFETVEVVQATKEIRHPDNPEIRKRITGTGRTSDDALKRLDKNIRRYYQELGLEQAGIPGGRARS